MNHLTNRMPSDGTPLDGRHGISGLCDGSSWRCITKRDRLRWFDHTRFRTTVRVSKQEQVMFESSSKSRKSRDGWQMIWQFNMMMNYSIHEVTYSTVVRLGAIDLLALLIGGVSSAGGVVCWRVGRIWWLLQQAILRITPVNETFNVHRLW